VRQAVTRSERRIEKKQAVVLLTLALGLVLVSFVLGVMVGRGTADRAAAVAQGRMPATHPLPPAPESGKAELTFYDDLPKGERAPLGSGINLPPASATPPPVPFPRPEPPAAAAAEPAPETPPAAATQPAVAKPEAAKPSATPPAPAKPAAAPPKATAAGGAFVVQVAAFRTAADARAMQTRLAGKGYAAYTQEANLGEKGVWHRVYVGPYGSAEAAAAAVGRLKSEERLSGMVRKR
jgi:cell division septation protein DedD